MAHSVDVKTIFTNCLHDIVVPHEGIFLSQNDHSEGLLFTLRNSFRCYICHILCRLQSITNKMACYSCSTKFSFSKKEKSCEMCLLSFCGNCVKHEAKFGSSVQKVCKACFQKTENKYNNYDESDPPAVLLKRLENLENPSQPPITIFRNNPTVEKLKAGLSSQDLEILDRLQKLKEKKSIQAVPSEDEIRSRLDALQGKARSEGPGTSKPPQQQV